MLISRKTQWGLPATAMAAALLVAGCGTTTTTGTTSDATASDTATPVVSGDSSINPPANQLIAEATATGDVTKKVADEIASAAVATPELGSVHQSTVAPDARRKIIGSIRSNTYKNRNVIFSATDGDGNFHHSSLIGGTDVDAPFDKWNGVEWKKEDDTGILRVRGYGTERGVMPLFALGYWLHVPDDATSAGSYEVGVFALGCCSYFRADNLPGLTGTATFEGDAVGLYAERAAVDDTPDINEFTAGVTLTADFDDVTKLGSVKGTVSKFNVGGMEKSLALSLGSATITDINSGFFKGDTSADGGFSGKWAGAFYYGRDAIDKPVSVIGTFGASNGDDLESFVGAFGARKQ